MSGRLLWVAGLFLGAAVGLPVASFGLPAVTIGAVLVALASGAARSLAMLAGAVTGVGGIWLALLVRAQLSCDAFDAAPQQGCQGFGVEPFATLSAAVLGAGVLLGALAWRRTT